MKIDCKELEKNRIELEIEVPAEEVIKEKEGIYAYLETRAKVPGFRSGKIPRDMLEKHFNDSVKHEIMEKLVPQYFQEAIKQKNLTLLTAPKFSDVKLDENNSLKFKAVVETRPAIDLRDYKNIKLTKFLVEISDEEIEGKLRELQAQASVFSDVQGRDDARDGDFAVVDFEGTLDGRPIKGWSKKNYSLEVGKENLAPGFTQAVTGMKKGETKNADIQFPADYGFHGLQGKTAVFKIALKDLKERKVPAVDEKLAKDFGFDSIAALKERIKEELKLQKEQGEKKRLIDEMVTRLVKGTSIDLPSTLIERQRDYMMYKLNNELANKNATMEDYLKANKLTEEKLKEKYSEAAEKQLKATLIFAEISNREGIKVEDEDVKNEIEKLAYAYRQDPLKLRRQLEQRGLIDNLREDILERKIIDFLFSGAKIEERGKPFWAGIGKLFAGKK